jgi:hypothetical protein
MPLDETFMITFSSRLQLSALPVTVVHTYIWWPIKDKNVNLDLIHDFFRKGHTCGNVFTTYIVSCPEEKNVCTWWKTVIFLWPVFSTWIRPQWVNFSPLGGKPWPRPLMVNVQIILRTKNIEILVLLKQVCTYVCTGPEEFFGKTPCKKSADLQREQGFFIEPILQGVYKTSFRNAK